MDDQALKDRIKALSPEKQAILRRKLQDKALETQGRVIPRRPDLEKGPLSFAQQRLWFLDRFDQASTEYNLTEAWRLRGELDRPAFERAVAAIVTRHEILRTHFIEDETGPAQVISPEGRVPIIVEDLRTLDSAARQTVVNDACQRELREPFNLAAGPLMRLKLLVLGERDHLLLRSCHHIIYDAWSQGVFFRELGALYSARKNGTQPGLPTLGTQYADYALWQRGWLQGETLAIQLAYWRSQLRGAPALELPADRPRPRQQEYAGARHPFVLPPDLSAKLKEFNTRENATPFMTLLAAFNVLLARYSGQRDILVGTPIVNRPRVELENLIGFFVNTLVLRSDLSGQPGFREVVGRIRRTALDAYQHQDVPFEKLVEELNPPRDLSRHPFFQVMFTVLGHAPPLLELPGLEVSQHLLPTHSTRFDLEMRLRPEGDSWVATLYYNTSLFDESTIVRFVGHYQNLLESMLEDPEQPVWSASMLAAQERRQLLVEWNNTSTDYPRHKCIHQLFEEQARKTPESVAVTCDGNQATYRQLNARASQLAGLLRNLGVGPGALAGIYIERSIELVAGLLAILKAGAAYVPLDPGFPAERLQGMLEDAGPAALLTTEKLAPALPSHQCKVVLLDRLAGAAEPVTVNSVAISPESPAYVLYTSGSTGRPKGVRIPHRAVVNFLTSMLKEPGITPDDSILAVTTVSFDIAGLEIFLPLTTGARVIIASRADASDGERLAGLITDTKATIMQATPSTWRMLVQSGWPGSNRLKILCGGEALPPDLARELIPRGREVWNLYGPTETTIWSSVTRLRAGEPVVIGRPIANTRFYVLDREFQLVPVGMPGELLIGGDGLALDYLNRPQLTSERFIPSPFATSPGERLYRTGDLVRYRTNGTIDFLGRQDHQVKIRGFRIELGEIEAALLPHQGVRQVVVVAREDDAGDRRLGAYFVPSDPASIPGGAELRDFLKPRLPDYMIPSTFTTMAGLPLMPNGKVDRKALPAPTSAPVAQADNGLEAPRNPVEKTLAAIWAEALGVAHAGIHDNFFELGGHSMLTLRLQSLVKSRLDVKLPLADFFQHPTVAGLAEHIESGSLETRSRGVLTVPSKGGAPPLFCLHFLSSVQRLGKHLGDERRVYGVESPIDKEINEWRQQDRKPISLEELAARYVKIIQDLEPHGPYHLAGYCFGGHIAFEVAQQLKRKGEAVGGAVLLDTIYYKGCRPLRMGGLKRLVYHARKFPRLGLPYLASKVRKQMERVSGWFSQELRRRARRATRLQEEADGPQGRFIEPIRDILIRYHGEPYDGDVLLFRTVAEPGSWHFELGEDNGWGAVVRGELAKNEIDCTHNEIFTEPCFINIASEIRRYLAKIDTARAAVPKAGATGR